MFYGRRLGRKLRDSQKKLLSERLPSLELKLVPADRSNGPFDMKGADELRLHASKFNLLEIGFGGGEHLFMKYASRKEGVFLGVEPYLNGVVSLLQKLQPEDDEFFRIYRGMAEDLVSSLRGQPLFDEVYILFPDPWPKPRHHKRRLISPQFLTELSTVLRPQGKLRISTDHDDYFQWIQEAIEAQSRFFYAENSEELLFQQFSEWVITKFQQKAMDEGRISRFIRLVKAST